LNELILSRLLAMARVSALAEMASGVAHELNQPLGAIATYSQAGDRLLNRPEPLVGRALDVFRQINTEALGAGESIRRIRRLFDRDSLLQSRHRIAEVLDELRPVLEMMAEWSAAQLTLDIAVDLPAVSIELAGIQHVLFSLFQNALEASAQGESPARVAVSARADRYAVEISVIDSGPGIAEDARDQMFRPFFTTKSKGTGLGLASSRAIVDAHQGTIDYQNNASGGARFWFRLPVQQA
jgi:two-component system sensor kinase FixL